MAKRAQEDPKISFAWNSRVVELHGEDSLTGVTLEDTVTGERRQIEATGLFVAIGQVPRSELVADVLELDEAGYIKVEAPSQRTRIPGVFACGDVADPTYQQAITAAGGPPGGGRPPSNWLTMKAAAAPSRWYLPESESNSIGWLSIPTMRLTPRRRRGRGVVGRGAGAAA